MAAASAAFAWRELDAIRVKGRAQAVNIYEPLGPAGEIPPERRARSDAYAMGLKLYRAKDFAGAAKAFATFPDDQPAVRFAERAQDLAQHPPGPDWEPVNALEEK